MSYLKRIRKYFYPLRIRLVVGVNTDEYVKSYKRDTVQKQGLRMETIKITGLADSVISAPDCMTFDLMNRMNFDMVVHGDDFTYKKFRESEIKWYDEKLVLSSHFTIIPRTPDISTTDIIETILNKYQSS
jgi:glycerol-3-phosphate cytidylyltransferase-like family protein